MGPRLGAITRLHAFPKPDNSVTESTVSGGIVTLLGAATALVLLVHELSFFLKPSVEHKMSVDLSGRHTKLPIHFDITFMQMPCQALSLSAQDAFGKKDLNSSGSEILKVRLGKDGHRLDGQTLGQIAQAMKGGNGSALPNVRGRSLLVGPDAEPAAASAKGLQVALAAGEGCRLSGQLELKRVSGSIQVAIQLPHSHLLQKVFPSAERANLSHRINTLAFGLLYPGMVNPLDGAERIVGPSAAPGHPAEESKADSLAAKGIGALKYFLKVVPTSYQGTDGTAVLTNQYAVTEYLGPLDSKLPVALPSVAFVYDLSPITVSIVESKNSVLAFSTRLCAIIGGAFALTGMVDRFLHRLLRHTTNSARSHRSR